MEKRWQYEYILQEEEKKISRLLNGLCGKDGLHVENASPIRPFPSSTSTFQCSVGTQVDEGELEIPLDDDLQGFSTDKAWHRWDSILEEQIRTDAKHYVGEVKAKLRTDSRTIKDLEYSIASLLQWKRSLINHFTLLTETFLMRIKTKITATDTISVEILEEMINLFANLESDLLEPIKLPKSIANLRMPDKYQLEGDEYENFPQGVLIQNELSTNNTDDSDNIIPQDGEVEDMKIITRIPFKSAKRSEAQLSTQQPNSSIGKLFQLVDKNGEETLSLSTPSSPPRQLATSSLPIGDLPDSKILKRQSIHLLSAPKVGSGGAVKKNRRLSVHLLNSSNSINGNLSANADEAAIIEEYICIECRKNIDLLSIKKPEVRQSVHVLTKEHENLVAYLFDLLSRIQACAADGFQTKIVMKTTPDISWIGQRVFLIFLFAFELLDEKELSLSAARSIFDRGILEASKRHLKMRSRLQLNDFVDVLAYVAEIIEHRSSKSCRLDSLIERMANRIRDLVKNPDWSHQFFSTFWDIGEDRLYNLLHFYRDSLFDLYQKSKSYGINKNKMKLSESHLVGSGFSPFEIFFINCNIVPDKIPSSAVRRIVQYVRPFFPNEGMSFILGCLFYTTIYMARVQNIKYKRSTNAHASDKEKVQEESWRIMEDLLVRIHRDP